MFEVKKNIKKFFLVFECPADSIVEAVKIVRDNTVVGSDKIMTLVDVREKLAEVKK